MSEYVIDFPNGGAADERIRLFHGAKMLYGYDLHEEIVRCRDCEHSRKNGTLCMFFAAWYPIAGGDEYQEVPAEVEPDGFCKWGKAKGEQR